MHLALNTQWRPRALLISHLFIGLLFASWLWPVTRVYWNQFDVWLFHLCLLYTSPSPRDS